MSCAYESDTSFLLIKLQNYKATYNRHQTKCAMISSAEHRERDLQTKIAIYLGLSAKLRGSENNKILYIGKNRVSGSRKE